MVSEERGIERGQRYFRHDHTARFRVFLTPYLFQTITALLSRTLHGGQRSVFVASDMEVDLMNVAEEGKAGSVQ
jgi:hypothetical protein